MATLTGNGAEEDAVPAIIKDGITKQSTDMDRECTLL